MNPARKPLLAGNWKMNLTLRESGELVSALAKGVTPAEANREVWVAPPFTALTEVAKALKGSSIHLAAQDVHWETSGAYTGEVSPTQLKDAGCEGAIIGHSERRRLFGDTDAVIAKKLKAALANKLVPIVCIGETLQEREAGKTFDVLKTQLDGAFGGFKAPELASVVVAYEPVWAIGTGKTATPDQAQEAHAFTRKTLAQSHGDAFANSLRILYGGSVTPENVDGLMAQPDVDGALVGGASLKAPSFLRIVQFKEQALK